jgi:membrane associated rhomboid family serine protease
VTATEFTRNSDNFCYRHPDRVSFVLCQRCLRTICPECQTQGAVGVVCPECMRAQQQAATPAQRKAERRWTPRPVRVSDGRPLVTYGIIAVTAFVYLLQLIPGLGGYVEAWLRFDLFYVVYPWKPLTVLLVHGSFLHVGLNMLALWMIGRMLEPLVGRWRFFTLYLLSGLGGSAAMAALAFGTPAGGASGAVFGLFGALLVIGRHIGADIAGIALVIGINLVIGFVPGFNVAWQAHVGGLVTGALVGFVYTRTRARSQRTAQILLLSGVAVLLVAVLVLSATLRLG